MAYRFLFYIFIKIIYNKLLFLYDYNKIVLKLYFET